MQGLLKLRREHAALRTGVQRHVAVADNYYVFTRETEGERLLVVFHNKDAAESVTLDLTNTSLANARTLTPILAASLAQLEGMRLHLQLPPNSLAVYEVQ